MNFSSNEKSRVDMTSLEGFCSICGHRGRFLSEPGYSLREAKCAACFSKKRSRDLAMILLKLLTKKGTSFQSGSLSRSSEYFLDGALHLFSDLHIFEAQSSGPVHKRLCNIPGYVASEYLEGVSSGSLSPDGVRCEDLEALSFADNSFDLVITQDVLEHVADPLLAFSEINRVLKEDGLHVFTLPIVESSSTTVRALKKGAEIEFFYPAVYHRDALRPEGSLVFTDFGADLPQWLTANGFPTEEVYREIFYSPEDVPVIRTEAEYRRYLSFKEAGRLIEYLHFNSIVFVSKHS